MGLSRLALASRFLAQTEAAAYEQTGRSTDWVSCAFAKSKFLFGIKVGNIRC